MNLLYLMLLFLYPVPECGPGALTTACNLPGYFDRTVLRDLRWDDAMR
jgi:hypothetical protein